MSGIFGIFNRDGQRASASAIEIMLDAMSYWEPDDSGVWQQGTVALGHTMLWNTAESRLEQLPHSKRYRTITMDARLDNREQLAGKLGMTDRPLEEITDSDLILSAYDKWGDGCTEYLLGDFAFAIWNEKERRLFCARDHIGIKPFYYYLSERHFIFSNDIRGLVAHSDVPEDFDKRAILRYLYDIEDQTDTLFAAIKPLAPASTLTVSEKEVSTAVYWRLEDIPKIQFDTTEEYSNRLRELLENAVQVRTRSSYPIASHLSGGLDSSAISVLAARHMQSGQRKLFTFNWTHSPGTEDNPEHREWSHSRKIAAREHLHHQYVDLTAEKLAEFYLQQNIAFNDRQYIWYEQLVRAKAKKHGVRTMMSGWGGDELISYNGRAVNTGIFWQGNPVKALRRIYRESKAGNNTGRKFLGKCYRELVMPLLPGKLHQPPGSMADASWNLLRCATDRFSRRVRKIRIAHNRCSRMSARQQQIDLFKQGHLQNRIDSWTASGFRDRIEYRYPLLDKRIVEFALAIPSDLYREKEHGRYLFRKTVENILPPEICWNVSKSEPRRVDLLYQLMFEAQDLWCKAVDGKCTTSGTGETINLDSIISNIQDMNDNWESTGLEKKLEGLIVIYRSIMILQMSGNDSEITRV